MYSRHFRASRTGKDAVQLQAQEAHCSKTAMSETTLLLFATSQLFLVPEAALLEAVRASLGRF